MIGLALRLFGVFGYIKRGIAWCFASPKRIAVVASLLAFAFLGFRLWSVDRDRDNWRNAARDYETAYLAWQAAFHKLVVDVELARVEAAKLDAENAARVAREMDRIKKETADDYDKALADTRSAARQLRDKLTEAATGDQSGSGEASVPGHLTARCQAFGYADCDALLAALPGLLQSAEDNTNKLIALQAWVRAILEIDINGEDLPA